MKAIPFHSSVRIKLGAGQQIKDKKGNIVGINVSAKTIKNKVAPPFRTCNFEIHFGKGVREHEQTFDVLRRFCKESGPVTNKDKSCIIEGTGAWKSLMVCSVKTGKTLLEKKFYKTEFGEVWNDPEFKPYVDLIFNAAHADIMGASEAISIDAESYEEIRQVAMILDDGFVDPEN